MTRDEALEKLKSVVELHGCCLSERSIEASLDGYLALGMLKLGEFKDPIEAFCDAYYGPNCTDNVWKDIREALDTAGLKIVSK